MNIKSIILFTALFIFVSYCNSQSVNSAGTFKQIIEDYSSRGTKALFKVWHFLTNRSYDYNTEEGIKRYKIFRDNVKYINEFNTKGESYQLGINHLTDMTFEEMKEYYKVKPLTPKDFKTNFRNLGAISLDDFNDEFEERSSKDYNVGQRASIDWTKFFNAIRDQQSCGSCWAFTTTAMLECNLSIKAGGTTLVPYLSTQELVDCSTSDYGCNGGWFSTAINYIVANGISFDSIYPYQGVASGSCLTKTKSGFKTSGYLYYSGANNIYTNLLAKGAVAVAMSIVPNFYMYSSGVFSENCATTVDHAVTLVGYGSASGVGYWILRNSWGTYWGLQGYFWIKDTGDTGYSCMITRYGYNGKLV